MKDKKKEKKVNKKKKKKKKKVNKKKKKLHTNIKFHHAPICINHQWISNNLPSVQIGLVRKHVRGNSIIIERIAPRNVRSWDMVANGVIIVKTTTTTTTTT